MLRVPSKTMKAYNSLLATRKTPKTLYFHYQKWLRYYLDFCYKYHFPAHDRDSLGHFMHKLHEKNQSTGRQKQASDAIAIYYHLLKGGVPKAASSSVPRNQSEQSPIQGVPVEIPKNAWDRVYDSLRAEIKVRQYSPKTLQTYAGWVRKFQFFTESKNPDTLSTQDVKDYLTFGLILPMSPMSVGPCGDLGGPGLKLELSDCRSRGH